LPKRNVDTRLKSPRLFVDTGGKPVLDQLNAIIDEGLFEAINSTEESFVLASDAKTRDRFNSGSLVPTAIE
jgi:hypothetical protein